MLSYPAGGERTALSKTQKAINAEFALYNFKPFAIEDLDTCKIKRSVKIAVGEQLFRMVETIVAFGNKQTDSMIKKQPMTCLFDIGHGMKSHIKTLRCRTGTYRLKGNVLVHHHNIYNDRLPRKQARENTASIQIGDTTVFTAYWRKDGINTLFTIGSTLEARKAFRIVQAKFDEIVALNETTKDQQ
jgi:hypothetical protein